MASNFPHNKNIKVSEKTVKMLRKGTMAGNLAKAKDASPELKEALIRFYGTKRVNAAAGSTAPKNVPAAAKRADSTPIRKSYVQTTKKNQSGDGSGKPMAVQKPKSSSGVSASSATKAGAGAVAAAGVSAAIRNKAKTRTIIRNEAKATNPSRSMTERNLAQVRSGRAKGLATKAEVKEAKQAAKTIKPRTPRSTGALNKMKAQGIKAVSGPTARAMQFKKK